MGASAHGATSPYLDLARTLQFERRSSPGDWGSLFEAIPLFFGLKFVSCVNSFFLFRPPVSRSRSRSTLPSNYGAPAANHHNLTGQDRTGQARPLHSPGPPAPPALHDDATKLEVRCGCGCGCGCTVHWTLDAGHWTN